MVITRIAGTYHRPYYLNISPSCAGTASFWVLNYLWGFSWIYHNNNDVTCEIKLADGSKLTLHLAVAHMFKFRMEQKHLNLVLY